MASYSDNFNRGDGEIGANWIEDSGDIDIVSNTAQSQTADVFNRARYASALASSDHYSQADVITGKTCIVTVRQAGSAHTNYQARRGGAWSTYRIYKVVSGTETLLVSGTDDGDATCTIKMECNGSTLTMYKNGTSKATTTDTAISTGTYAGIEKYTNNGGWDNWTAADLAVTTAYPYYYFAQ
jgi:hypothetical protein